ncbi:MAG: prepilin-type N-terminal cleavage/methylation domain-containing protein [Candidatus Kaiserbacteria bacterium]|nr:prepilin-type N-terminal cleavage/methylation domain-containing protein [Candidatus Kaiserbacteria bacterium]
MQSSQIKTKENGFTLVETLVAISILLVIIVGPMTIAQKGIQNAFFAREQLTAVFLAQEAIEGVRELRDNDAIVSYEDGSIADPGTQGWLPSGCNDAECAYDDGLITLCSANNECVLKYTAGIYDHDGTGDNSIYKRRVAIGASNGGGVPVTVTVTWAGKVRQGEIVLQSWIYDHYQRYED